MTPREVCEAKCKIMGIVSCFAAERNSVENRTKIGINPQFSGCPACHREAEKENAKEKGTT